MCFFFCVIGGVFSFQCSHTRDGGFSIFQSTSRHHRRVKLKALTQEGFQTVGDPLHLLHSVSAAEDPPVEHLPIRWGDQAGVSNWPNPRLQPSAEECPQGGIGGKRGVLSFVKIAAKCPVTGCSITLLRGVLQRKETIHCRKYHLA